MKTIKINLVALAAVAGLGLALAGSPAAHAGSKPSTSWFSYNGSGSVTDPANYTEVSGTPSCPGTSAVCSIRATVGSGNKPVITTALSNEINNDLSSHTASANVQLQDN